MSNSTKNTETQIQINDILYIDDKESDDNDVEQFVYINNDLVIISYDSDDSVTSDDDTVILVS